jgi:hypothetical protein
VTVLDEDRRRHRASAGIGGADEENLLFHQITRAG